MTGIRYDFHDLTIKKGHYRLWDEVKFIDGDPCFTLVCVRVIEASYLHNTSHNNNNKDKETVKAWIPTISSLRSRRLEVVGTRKNGRARGRHARGVTPRVSPSRAPAFSLSPTTSKRLLRRLYDQSRHQLIGSSTPRTPQRQPRDGYTNNKQPG